MNRRYKFFALAFIFMLALTATAFFQIEPVTAVGSQTKYVFASGAPTYTYGSSSSGSYLNTILVDSSYHVSTATSLPEYHDTGMKNPASAGDWSGIGTLAWSNPTYAESVDGNFASVGINTGISHYLYTYDYGFGVPSGATIVGVKVGAYWKTGASTNVWQYSIQLGKAGIGFFGNDKSTGQPIPYNALAWTYWGGSSDLWNYGWSVADVNTIGNGAIEICISVQMVSAVCYVDVIQMQIYYTIPVYRVDYYYNFQFTDSARAQVTQLDWQVWGKDSVDKVVIYLWNWQTSAWVQEGWYQTYDSGIISQGLTVNSFMDSSGNMRVRFASDTDKTSSFTCSVNLLYWKVTYTPLVPTTPTLISPTDGAFIAPSSVNLTWSGADTYFLRYQLQTALDDAFTGSLTTYNQTATFKVLDLIALSNATMWWRVRIVNIYQDVSVWASRRFTIEDPLVSVVFRDANNAALNEMVNPAAFNTTYHRSIQDGAGVWHTLSPYFPIINMYSNELVNITVRDWLGNYLINNQSYTYSPTILLDLDIFDVCVGNGADAMAYIILRSGSTIMHKFTYRSDIHWLVIAGNYNLTVIYPAVGNAQVYYNLSITGDYGIKVSSDMIADLYSATDNWEALTGNVANIVTIVGDVKTEVYSFDDTEASTREKIGTVDSLVRGVADNTNILNWIIIAFAAAMGIALFSIWSRMGARKGDNSLDHYRETTNAVDRQVAVITAEQLKKAQQGGS